MKKNGLNSFFTEKLMYWNERFNTRQMPWKAEKDPYKIWISEIILQQTRVEQGLDYYNRFVKKYPNVKKLAVAKDTEVFKVWEGLGYYSRCKNLIASARFIAKDLNGVFPKDYITILQLRGVGPYTAAAIGSFAFNLPYAVVDGNVNRVLARFFGITTAIDTTVGKSLYTNLAQELLHKTKPGLYNQAIMDFGATICKPQLPLCGVCTLQKKCRAFNYKQVDLLPIKEKKIIKKQRWLYYLAAKHKDKFFVRQRIEKDIWQNLHEFVLIEKNKKITGNKVAVLKNFPGLKHEKFDLHGAPSFYSQQLTHQTLHVCLILITFLQPPNLPGYNLVSKKKLEKLAFPKMLKDFILLHKPFFGNIPVVI